MLFCHFTHEKTTTKQMTTTIPPPFRNNHALLYLYVNKENKSLCDLYEKHVAIHNQHVRTDKFPNSGFDIFFPEKTMIHKEDATLVDFEIVAEMQHLIIDPNDPQTPHVKNTAFYVYPRSSISKTPLMLSNSVGIIDQGYRGNIKCSFRSTEGHDYMVDKYTRMSQICHPSLLPIEVLIVHNLEDLSTSSRDAGGFGSTGLVGTTKNA